MQCGVSLPDALDAVGIEVWIRGDDRQAVTFYLYDEQTFERVFVMQHRLDVDELVEIERECAQSGQRITFSRNDHALVRCPFAVNSSILPKRS